ncbi:MAG: DUF5611 family protein [Candidatus Lutacidiplasmatales archaeon]
MQNYPVRPSHRANLTPENLERIARNHFTEVTSSEGLVTAKYGALDRLAAKAAGRELSIEVAMNPKVAIEVAQETIRRYNRFLEETTGYSTKERARRLKKAVTGAAD